MGYSATATLLLRYCAASAVTPQSQWPHPRGPALQVPAMGSIGSGMNSGIGPAPLRLSGPSGGFGCSGSRLSGGVGCWGGRSSGEL